MATRSTRSTRSRTSTGDSSRSGSSDGYRDDMGEGTRGRMGVAARNGVHVKAEMASPRVARITIEIDWQQLASKVARKVGRRIKAKASQARRARSSTRRASSR